MAGSLVSLPFSTERTMALSSADLEMGPTLSIDQLRAMAPCLLIRPKVGRSPVTPFRVEGDTMEPRVSVPMAKGTNPALTAEAEPAEDPLDPCFRFQGFLVTPPNQTSPMAKAPRVNFPTSTPPACSSLVTIVAVSLITWSLYGSAPQVVRVPGTANKSLIPKGIPCRGPRYLPAASSWSRAFAWIRALSSKSVTRQAKVSE